MTSAIGTIRPFTAEDAAALNSAAVRFADRHLCINLPLDLEDQPWQAMDLELWARPDTWTDTKRLRRLWQACKCRALGQTVRADITVAYGYVGYRVR